MWVLGLAEPGFQVLLGPVGSMTCASGQSSWSVTRIRLPKISSSSPAWASWSIRQARRSVAGVSPVERKPDSPEKQGSLREDLTDLDGTPDAVDDELLDAARQLIAAVKARDAAAGAAIGIDLDEFEAASLRVSSVTSEGTAVRGRNWKIAGDAMFENIRAGRSAAAGPPAPTEGGGDERPQ